MAIHDSHRYSPFLQRYRFLKRKALAAVATTAVLFGGAAAAATGSLPGPVQDGVSKSLSHIGMDVPAAHDSTDDSRDPTNHVPATVDDSSVSRDSGPATSDAPPVTDIGPDADGSAKKGLCTAYAASSDSSGKNLDSPAFRNLTDAAAKAGQSIDEYCAAAAAPTKTDDNGKKVPFEVKKGDRILVSKYGGTEIKLDGKEYKILNSDDVLAVID